ncbi:MAG: hypothetical protein H6966_00015 [Chromatiaceae bacterium]|nr:hypothetical protein [Chromatiaceae bacterium]
MNTQPNSPESDSPGKVAKPAITPGGFFFCLLMAIPAVLAAKLVTVGIFDPFVGGFYRGAGRPRDETYLFLTQFVSCGLAGFVFVSVGALTTPKIRSFSVWFFATFAVVGALALSDMNGLMGLIGQILGAVIAAFIFWKR